MANTRAPGGGVVGFAGTMCRQPGRADVHHQIGRAEFSRSRTWRLLLAVCLITGAAGLANLMAAATSAADVCDKAPTDVDISDYWLDFTVPPGLMADPQFDGRPARLEVHRIQPVYRHGRCPEVAASAAVLIHGRTGTGPVAFDLRHSAPGGGNLSVQEGLARAGIDTFAPSLLGYGQSTRFAEGLDDPGNTSLRPYEADATTCLHPEPCDRTNNALLWLLDQQGTLLKVNPLAGKRRAHTRVSALPLPMCGYATSARSSTTRSAAPSRRMARSPCSATRSARTGSGGPSTRPTRSFPAVQRPSRRSISTYGWNSAVAGQLAPPTLVMQESTTSECRVR